MNRSVHFNDAIIRLAQYLHENPISPEPIIIRDIYGRIKLALDCEQESASILSNSEFHQKLKEKLGEYYQQSDFLYRNQLFDPDAIFSDDNWLTFQTHEYKALKIIDRQIIGQEWGKKHSANSTKQSTTPTFVFFGLKGGVGRSTALALLAYYFAKNNKRVLLIDLDLESPGLSSLLLPEERAADYGIVDWLIEDELDQATEIFSNMIASSSLSDNLPAEIKVVAATGGNDPFYVDKLSRVYNDKSTPNGVETFSQRIQRLMKQLEAKEKPDVVLIDSRAGLHDLAAISIVELANTTSFLFATNTEQTWQGYRRLFKYWQARPDIAREVRERLTIVEALFPEANQAERQKAFLQKSHDLFSKTLYDEVPPNSTDDDVFHFDIEDDAAPHFPVKINWDSRFQEFNPIDIASGVFTQSQIDASFKSLFDRAERLIGN